LQKRPTLTFFKVRQLIQVRKHTIQS